ncbi:unnamed protein product [Ascophyllum nodosum]
MEGYVEGEDGADPFAWRVKTRAGAGSAQTAGLLAARSSGDAEATSPVHGAYGMAEVEDEDDLLASHMEFMQRKATAPQQRPGSKSSLLSRRSSAQLSDVQQQADAPIAFVAIVMFDLNRQGPCLVCVDPPIEDADGKLPLRLTPADVRALRTDMPFKALPENGLAAAELATGANGQPPPKTNASGIWSWARFTRAAAGSNGGDGTGAAGGDPRGKQHHDHCLFMMRLAGENLFGMSHFLRVEDPSSPRGYTQGAAVCLSRLPFFGMILQRLHSFSTDVIDRTACADEMVALAADLRNTRFEELGHSAVYQDLPVATALLKLKGKLLVILRLLLLEGRVLFYAKSAATVSEAVMAVASVLPGSLPLGLGRLDPPGFGPKAYRWRKYGFPLKLFRKDVPLEPLLVIAGAADVLSQDGFLAGTTNSMVQALPSARLDLLLDVDSWSFTSFKTDRARAALEMGESDRSFVRELGRATKRHLGGGGGSNDSSQAAAWQGSSAWISDQFQLYFEGLANTAASCLERNARLEEERRRSEEQEEQERRKTFQEGKKGSTMELIAGVVSPTIEGMGLDKAWQQTTTWLNGSGPIPVAIALEAHGRRWAELWAETENFAVWKASHRLSPPQAPALARSSSRRTALPGGSAGDGRNGSPAAASAKTNVFASAAATAVASAGSVLARARESDNGLAAAGLCRSGFVAGALFGVGDGMWGAGIGEGGVRPRLVTVPPRSGVHAYVYESGDTYVGNWKNGRRHGVGVYEERATGNSYEGDWCEDLRHGRGVLTSGAKDFLYDGEWVKDKRTGRGNCVIRGRETYSGLWKDGEFHGRGVHCDARGNVYDGEFVHGQREGVGRWTAKEGTEGMVYIGEWKAGRRCGVGQSTAPDGTVYSGEWHDGLFAGEGTLTLSSGERYEGMFRDGEKHGSGSLQTQDGDTLEGEWTKSKPQEGDTEWRIRFSNGDHFAGTVLEGVPHGRGTYKYANGDVFTGGWDCGLRQGQGICVFANGERFEGDWERDHISYQGKGALTLADGTTHDFA